MSIPVEDVDVNEMFTDVISNRTTTDVYANGKMQACVFPVADYHGTGEVTEEDLREHVKKHVVIYSISNTGEKTKVDWEYSSESNGYNHDINFAPPPKKKPGFTNRVRVPFYFTVPTSASGDHRWIAKYDENFMPDMASVTVTCHSFSAPEGNFDFAEVSASSDRYHLRSLRYTHLSLPTPLRLVKCIEYQGTEIRCGGTVGICWQAFYGAFYETFNLLGYGSAGTPPDDDISDHYVELSQAFTSTQIDNAWGQGVAVIAFYFGDNPTFTVDKVKVEDNYGNRISVDFEQWSVKNPVVILDN